MRTVYSLSVFAILALGFGGQSQAQEEYLVLSFEDSDEEMVFYPGQVEEGPGEEIYILDLADSYIKVFDRQGEFVKKLAGEGEGPGEFQRVDGASFGFTPNEELYFTEFVNGHRWITLLNSEGNLKEVISPEIETMFGVTWAKPLETGQYIVQFWYNSQSRPVGNYYLYESPYSISLMNAQGEIEKNLLKISITDMISFSPNGGTIGLPFTPFLYWSLLGENEVVWTDGMSPVLQVVNINGQATREIQTPLPASPEITESDLTDWKARREAFLLERNPSWYHRIGRVIQEYSDPPNGKPVIGSLETTPQGNLLVRGSAGAESLDYIYWLLDPKGERLTSVDVDVWGVHFSSNYLFWMSEDQDEEVQVHALRHNRNEPSGLNTMLELMGPAKAK